MAEAPDTPFPTTEPTLGALVAAASRDVSTLVRAEIALAKSELRADLRAGATAAGLLGGAGVLGLLAVVLLSVAAAYGLVALGLAPGWAFLVVAGAYLLVAGILALVARGALRRVGPPRRTIRSVKDSVALVGGGRRAA